MPNQDTKTSLKLFAAKATQALKRRKSLHTFTMSFPSFAKDEDGEALKIKFRALSDAEINEVIAYESDDQNAPDKYAVFLASVDPSLPTLANELKEAGDIRFPLEIMDMFERHEIAEASTLIMQESGVLSKNKVTIVEKAIDNLKN